MRLLSCLLPVLFLCGLPATALAETAGATKEKPRNTNEDPPQGPENKAAPPTTAGTTGLFKVTPGLEIFAQYSLRRTSTLDGQAPWFHIFDVPRVHAAVTGEFGPATGRIVLEAVRSASEGALIGVAGDSLVVRLREAWVGYRHKNWFSAAMGVVPTLTVPELEGTWRLRVVGPAPLEQTGMASPADLGLTGRIHFPKEFGFLAVGVYNGEGYTRRELNRGKNVEIAASLHPVPVKAARPLGIFGSYIIGSSGTGAARADRLTTSLLWQGIRLRAGAGMTYAWGLDNDGARRSVLLDAFFRVEPIDRLMFGLRGSYWNRNIQGSAPDTLVNVTGSVGYRWARPFETHLAVTKQAPTIVAQSALPGSDFWEFRLVSRFVL
jgi:hypothetical protein